MQSASVDTHAVEQYLTCYPKRYTHTQKQANKQNKPIFIIQRTLLATNSEETPGFCLSKNGYKNRKVKFSLVLFKHAFYAAYALYSIAHWLRL